MTNWAELTFLAEEMGRRMKAGPPLPPPRFRLKQQQYGPGYSDWLNEGPDDYDAFEETVVTQELRRDYTPNLLWGGSLFNSAGDDVRLRFTDDYGKTKQYPIPSGTAFNLIEVKGKFTVFQYVSDGSSTVRGFIELKRPFPGSP